MTITKTFTLSVTGAKIPAIGFGIGTKWFKPGDSTLNPALVDVTAKAIAAGLTHLDGAEIYGTDGELGAAVAVALKAGSARSDLWITNKYFAGDSSFTHRSLEANPLEAIKAQLAVTGVKYFDLYLLHSPFIKKETHGFSLQEAWRYLEEAKELGLVKNIGVSNFDVASLEAVLATATLPPQVHQIEFHAYLQDQTPGIVEFSQKHDILITAYSPLVPLYKGPGPIDSVVAELAVKYHKTSNQILLNWVLQRGILPITTTSKEERLAETTGAFDFELTSEEVERITTLGAQKRVRVYWKTDYGHYDE